MGWVVNVKELHRNHSSGKRQISVIVVLTRARHWAIFWTTWIQSWP